ncbi:MAG TPA: DUF6752 domain-containing protein [Nocardioidaceae bacterium]|jgi:chromosome segregation ATPase
MKPLDRLKKRALDRLASATAVRLEADRRHDKQSAAQVRSLVKRVDRLQATVGRLRGQVRDLRGKVDRLRGQVRDLKGELQEARRLSGRLSDVVDVVTEVLVPAADRDDRRMQDALDRLDAQLRAAPRLDDRDPQRDPGQDG